MKVMFFELSLTGLEILSKWLRKQGVEMHSHPCYKEFNLNLFDAAFDIPEGRIIFAGIHADAFGMCFEKDEDDYVVIKREEFRKVDIF